MGKRTYRMPMMKPDGRPELPAGQTYRWVRLKDGGIWQVAAIDLSDGLLWITGLEYGISADDFELGPILTPPAAKAAAAVKGGPMTDLHWALALEGSYGSYSNLGGRMTRAGWLMANRLNLYALQDRMFGSIHRPITKEEEEPYLPRMMPGQEPYTAEEYAKLTRLVADAAAGDPGEAGERT